jgi:signal peptidase
LLLDPDLHLHRHAAGCGQQVTELERTLEGSGFTAPLNVCFQRLKGMKAETSLEGDEPRGNSPGGSFRSTAVTQMARGAGYLRSRARVAGEGLLLVCLGLAVLAVVGTAFNWCRLDVVLSGSMAPTLRPGDVILAVSERDSQVSAGQVLAFHPPSDPNIVVVHRVIQVIRHDNKVEIRTQGDDNNAPDQWTAVLEGTSAWRVSWVLPSAGYVGIWVTYPWIHLLALLLVIGIVVWEVLRRVWRAEPR